MAQRAQSLFLRAEPETTPAQIKITNITDTSFTVSWLTDKAAAGLLHFSENSNLDSTAPDDRDQPGEASSFTTHHVTVKNLKPKTIYYFKIRSGAKVYDQNGRPYQLSTAPAINLPSPPNDLVYGRVVKQDDLPAQGVIVYLSLANTTPQSALVQESGNWVIPLNLARSTDLDSYAAYDQEASIEEILVQASQELTATAVTTTKYDSPVPTIKLGQNFDFRDRAETIEVEEQEEIIPPIATKEAEPATPPASKFTIEPESEFTATKELAIINPDEAEKINTQKPAIIGRGPAGAVLEINLESPTSYSGTTVIDNFGNWQWSPPDNLEPGEHTVTASYTDEEGKKHSVSHTFTVLAAETELPAIEATPSATLTPSPMVTASPTPTTTPTTVPATRAAIPSTDGGVPEPGHLTPTFLIFIMGAGLILMGFVIKAIIMK